MTKIIFAIVLTASLAAACGSKSNKSTTPDNTTGTTPATGGTTYGGAAYGGSTYGAPAQ